MYSHSDIHPNQKKARKNSARHRAWYCTTSSGFKVGLLEALVKFTDSALTVRESSIIPRLAMSKDLVSTYESTMVYDIIRLQAANNIMQTVNKEAIGLSAELGAAELMSVMGKNQHLKLEPPSASSLEILPPSSSLQEL